MSHEIERKFLVKGDFKPFVKETKSIIQGYLNSTPERSVRVRIKGENGYLTVKGNTSESGTTRFEWETIIELEDAENLLELCEPGIINKTRNLVRVGKHIFEVDEFHGENEGLIIAEIELSSEEEQFIKPEWLGNEVTGDMRYYNSSLTNKPFTKW